MKVGIQGKSSTETKTYERCDAGAYAGRCIRVVDNGTYTHPVFKNQKTNLPEEVSEMEITFELSELMEDGKPFIVSATFNKWISQNSKFGKFLVGWLGEVPVDSNGLFDPKQLIGKTAMLNVTKQPNKKDPNKFYNGINTAMPLPKGMAAIDQVNESLVFDLEDDMKNIQKLKSLWPLQRKNVERSHEWRAVHATMTVQQVIEADQDDSIPF